MAEEHKRQDTHDEISDTELNELFDQLHLDIPDPPNVLHGDWVMGTLVTDTNQCQCEYTDWYHEHAGQQGRLVKHKCRMYEHECDSYVHALWRASSGRTVRTLVRCSTHKDRLEGGCLLCLGIVDATLVHSDDEHKGE